MKKIKISLLSLMLLYSTLYIAQQETQYNMYMFNQLSVNPGYAGTRNGLSVVALYRNQWTGFKGAPKTVDLTIHSPIKNSNLSVGFSLTDDRLGTTVNTSFNGDIAYKVKLFQSRRNGNKHFLSFGLKAGLDLFNANNTQALINDNNDALYYNVQNKPLLNLGFGIYYYSKKHYLGFSSPKLIENHYSDFKTNSYRQIKHYYLVAGYITNINSVIQFKPSMALKAVKNAPLSADLNASFLFYDKLWLGANYRLKESAGINIAFYINDYLTIGYYYGYSLSNIRKYSSGSHEIMIGFDMNKKSRSFKTPRYF